MSKAAKAEKAKPQIGDRNPNNPNQIWVICLSNKHEGGRGRWVTTTTPHKLAAAGFEQRCLKCAQRERWERPGARHGKLNDRNRTLPSGSVDLREERTRDDIKNRVSVFACGICGEKHRQNNSSGEKKIAFCNDCNPWVKLLLEPGQYAVPSPERDASYAKIRRVRKALKRDTVEMPAGRKMPFWALAKRWAEEYQRENKALSWKFYSAHYRHMLLFFEGKPIGKIGANEVRAFEAHLMSKPGLHGERSPTTVGHMMETLRRVLNYARRQGWLDKPPLTGGALVSRYAPLKSDRIMTVDEEDRLLAACVGEFAPLREPLIYMADTGAYNSDREELHWPDVHLEEGLIKCSGGFVEMTPRLASAMREMWERSGRPVEGQVWSPRPRLRDIFPKLCAAAGLEGLELKEIRRTAAWRMAQARIDTGRIGDVLKLSGLNFVRRLVNEVNPAIAQQEIRSLRFQEFMRKDFGASVNGNGNGEKRVRGRKAGDTFLDYDGFVSNLKACAMEEWRAMGCSITAVKQEEVLARYHNMCPGDRIAASTLKSRLVSAGYEMKWPEFVEITVKECATT